MNPQLQQAIAHLNAGENEPAKAILRRLLQRNARDVEANKLMGMVLAGEEENEQALFFLQRAAALAPSDPLMQFMHGNILMILKKDKEALEAYRKVSKLAPAHFDGYDGQAKILLRMGRHEEAVAAYEAGLRATPVDPVSYRVYAIALSTMGRVDEAIAVLRRGIERLPKDPGLRESLCYQLNFTDAPNDDVFRQHAELGRLVQERNAGRGSVTLPNTREPERVLRVGFVSGDFCTHACALFMEGLIANLDRAKVRPYCYYLREDIEPTTERFRAMSEWRHVAALDEEAFRAAVLADGIDILIDAGGWTEFQRLSAFSPRIAPVQMTWLGYPNTTGIPEMDYRIVDAVTDPAGAEAFATEKLLRLEGCFLSFTPVETAPEGRLTATLEHAKAAGIARAEDLPADKPLMFGSFNRLSKVRPEITRTWARVLARVPNARLFLKSHLVSDDVKGVYHGIFREEGVDPARIVWSSFLPTLESHLAAYHQVDIALDSYPYNGTTTTCEATWMGVPVITLAGSSHRSRVGASLLTALGLEDQIASSHEQFVERAAGLAGDLPRLIGLHGSLRERMRGSVLCDTRGFAGRFEAGLRGAWRAWCKGGD
ncbi:MAG TPA: tetratricopeptide repeat protein [Phycisphaerales bacterium]|nr:tetratricopeptide repeat protein [Phycisphaerales bacterium]